MLSTLRPNPHCGHSHTRKSQAKDIPASSPDPLETPSYDAFGKTPEPGQLIPNPKTYPAESRLEARDPMRTTWGFGHRENLYNNSIVNAVEANWPDPELPLSPLTFKALVAAESAFDKDAVSRTGAVGLVQITGGTARAYGLRTDPPPDERRDPAKALQAGVKILADKHALIKSPPKDRDYSAPVAEYYETVGKPSPEQTKMLSLAGYNGGASTVLRAMNYAIADGQDPRDWANLVAADKDMLETPLYKAIEDTFGDKFAPGKYHEMAAYPVRINSIEAREYHPLEDRKIMVDAGHGGTDPGARGPAGGRETDVNLGVSLKLRDKLEALGAEVRMTRETDTNVGVPGGPQREELKARVKLGNDWPAEVFVSVHSNSAANPAAHGTETYHSRNASQASRQLAAAVHGEMVDATGFRDRRVKAADFYVIKNTNMPAVLVETGFISNPVEEGHLVNPEMQDKMAEAITRGLDQVFGSVGLSEVANPSRVVDPPVEFPPASQEQFLAH